MPQVDLGAYERTNPLALPTVDGVRWTSDVRMVWTATAEATRYHVYRGTLGSLVTGTGFTCLDGADPDRSDTAFEDAVTPAPSALLIYLLTVEDDSGNDGGPGRRTCADRTIAQPCP